MHNLGALALDLTHVLRPVDLNGVDMNWLRDKYALLTQDEKAMLRLVLGVIALLAFVVLMGHFSATR